MNIGLFCIWCGGRLGTGDGHVTCLDCGTEFSNVLVSETMYENHENTFLEMSVSMDCVKAKGRYPQGVYPIAIERPAMACE